MLASLSGERAVKHMEFSDLDQGAKAVACGGHVFNCQELTGLQVGLTVLRSRENIPAGAVYLWGKILGTTADYFVAYGLKESEAEFPQKVFFYASEDFEFKHLPYPSQGIVEQLVECDVKKPFTGNVDQVIGKFAGDGLDQPPTDDVDAQGRSNTPKITELDLLGHTVVNIDFDTAVVPRGAHRLNEANVVVVSTDFRGLNATEAVSLSRYVHFRPPGSVDALRAVASTDAEFYANFLDPLENDLPRGCWAIRQDPAATVVTLRSLSWPGYVAYHVPETVKFGGLYCGYGHKSRDLAFLL